MLTIHIDVVLDYDFELNLDLASIHQWHAIETISSHAISKTINQGWATSAFLHYVLLRHLNRKLGLGLGLVLGLGLGLGLELGLGLGLRLGLG